MFLESFYYFFFIIYVYGQYHFRKEIVKSFGKDLKMTVGAGAMYLFFINCVSSFFAEV